MLALLAALGGCGLSDYEARMREAQARLKRFDEENKLLGEPLQVPTRTDEKTKAVVPVADAFVRPPRGIMSMPEKEPRSGLLYRYPPAQGGAAPFTQVEVAYGTGQKDFVNEVLDRFGNTNEKPKKRQIRSAAGEQTRTILSLEFDDGPTGYSINIFLDEKTPLAVVFWLAPKQFVAARRTIEMCLEWTGAGPEADRLRKAFAYRSPLLGRRPPGSPRK
jgi:hypothetical protein